MAELFGNDAITTLNGNITSGTSPITVTSGAVFPATGNFRIRIDNEYMLCTARSSNSLTVTRGIESSTAAAHNNGATVRHVITAGGLAQAISEGGHTRAHAISSTSDHTESGLTAGWVLGADSATTFSWQQLLHSELGSVGSDDHHSANHTITSAAHTGSLTPSAGIYTGVVQVDYDAQTWPYTLTGSMATVAAMSIAAAEVWMVDIYAWVTDDASPTDIRVQWSLPANVTHRTAGSPAWDTAATAMDLVQWTTSTKDYGSRTSETYLAHLVTELTSTSGSGTCNFQAQYVATGPSLTKVTLVAHRLV